MQAPTLRPARGTSDWPGSSILRLKLLGLVCAAGPLAVLVLFAVGEGVIEEGWGHLLQAAPLLLLVLLAWWRPLVGGALMTIAATGLGVFYAVTAFEHSWWLPTAAMFFLPAIIGGLLFLSAGIVARRQSARRDHSA
jgi:hypothetical protein